MLQYQHDLFQLAIVPLFLSFYENELKYGIEALSEALRMEVAKSGVKVSLIEPGVTETNLQSHFENHPKNVLGISEPLLPEDISRCVKFILEQPEHVRIPVMMVLPGEQAM